MQEGTVNATSHLPGLLDGKVEWTTALKTSSPSSRAFLITVSSLAYPAPFIVHADSTVGVLGETPFFAVGRGFVLQAFIVMKLAQSLNILHSLCVCMKLSIYRVSSFPNTGFNKPKQIKYDAQNTQTCHECVTRQCIVFEYKVRGSKITNWILKYYKMIPDCLSRQWAAMLFVSQAKIALPAMWLKTRSSKYCLKVSLF